MESCCRTHFAPNHNTIASSDHSRRSSARSWRLCACSIVLARDVACGARIHLHPGGSRQHSVAGGRRGYGSHVLRALCPAQRDRKSAHARRLRRDAIHPMLYAADQPVHRRAFDGRPALRVVRRDADAGRARIHGPQLRHIARESGNCVEGAISMGSAPCIFRMAGAFDWLRDVFCEPAQYYSDRDDSCPSWSGESIKRKCI